jgi:hypothetical protein
MDLIAFFESMSATTLAVGIMLGILFVATLNYIVERRRLAREARNKHEVDMAMQRQDTVAGMEDIIVAELVKRRAKAEDMNEASPE